MIIACFEFLSGNIRYISKEVGCIKYKLSLFI